MKLSRCILAGRVVSGRALLCISLSLTLALSCLPAVAIASPDDGQDASSASFPAEASRVQAPSENEGVAAEAGAPEASDVPARAAEPLSENSWRFDNGAPVISDEDSGYSALSRTVENAWCWNGEGFINSLGQLIPHAKSKGIDVSEHQGTIDWDKVAKSDVDYVIIRCGYGDDLESQDDKQWARNVRACIDRGIPYGVYIYSYASTTEMALSEANHVIRLLRAAGADPAYPVYLDLEDERVRELNGLGARHYAAMAKTFCDALAAAGYTPGVYANTYWWNTYLTDPVFDSWERWVAQYNATCTYEGRYAMWQCTNAGKIDGISNAVDINMDLVYRGRSYGAYYDVSASDWFVAEGYFDYVVGQSIMKGSTDEVGRLTGYFNPYQPVTRADFVTMLYRIACPESNDTFERYPQNTSPFTDNTSGSYFTAAINWAASKGILTGIEDGNGNRLNVVNPSGLITRQDVCTILYRFARAYGFAQTAPSPDAFQDLSDAFESDWYAHEAIAWCYDAGIMTGSVQADGSKLLKAHDSTLRSEATKIMTVLARDIVDRS